MELLFGFGWRKGELTGLTVGNVNLAENFIRLEDSKNGEPREVPLTLNLKVLLQAIIAGRSPGESLFPVSPSRICATLETALQDCWSQVRQGRGLRNPRLTAHGSQNQEGSGRKRDCHLQDHGMEAGIKDVCSLWDR